MKRKIKLEDLKLNSFLTELNDKHLTEIYGGTNISDKLSIVDTNTNYTLKCTINEPTNQRCGICY